MATPKQDDMSMLTNLLPAYINGTASDTERQWVDALVARSAQARAALAWHEALAAKVVADVDSAPNDIGWARLLARARADAPPQPVRSSVAPGWLAQVGHWLAALAPHRWLPAPALGGACAVLLAVVVGQALYFGQFEQDDDYATVRGAQPHSDPAGLGTTVQERALALGQVDKKFVRLNFRDRVTERDMRLLLVQTGSVIIGGPGQLGDYIVAVPAAELSRAIEAYRASYLTESAQEVPPSAVLQARESGSTGTAPAQAASQTQQ